MLKKLLLVGLSLGLVGIYAPCRADSPVVSPISTISENSFLTRFGDGAIAIGTIVETEQKESNEWLLSVEDVTVLVGEPIKLPLKFKYIIPRGSFGPGIPAMQWLNKKALFSLRNSIPPPSTQEFYPAGYPALEDLPKSYYVGGRHCYLSPNNENFFMWKENSAATEKEIQLICEASQLLTDDDVQTKNNMATIVSSQRFPYFLRSMAMKEYVFLNAQYNSDKAEWVTMLVEWRDNTNFDSDIRVLADQYAKENSADEYYFDSKRLDFLESVITLDTLSSYWKVRIREEIDVIKNQTR